MRAADCVCKERGIADSDGKTVKGLRAALTVSLTRYKARVLVMEDGGTPRRWKLIA